MGAVDVGLVVGLADGDHIGQVAHPGVPGVLHAAIVGHQGIGGDVRMGREHIPGQLRRVRHLRNGLGADEGRGLQQLHTGVHQPVDDALFLLDGQQLLQILPSVPGSAFKNMDVHLLTSAYQF